MSVHLILLLSAVVFVLCGIVIMNTRLPFNMTAKQKVAAWLVTIAYASSLVCFMATVIYISNQ